jgi:hypothetical protein
MSFRSRSVVSDVPVTASPAANEAAEPDTEADAEPVDDRRCNVVDPRRDCRWQRQAHGTGGAGQVTSVYSRDQQREGINSIHGVLSTKA